MKMNTSISTQNLIENTCLWRVYAEVKSHSYDSWTFFAIKNELVTVETDMENFNLGVNSNPFYRNGELFSELASVKQDQHAF